MRPYLALIKDSFRAAIASSVLYVMLGVITLLLLVIAPLHVREALDWRLRFGNNVTKVSELSQRLVERGDQQEENPALHRVWSRLDSGLQQDLQSMVEARLGTDADDETGVTPQEANRDFMQHRRTEKTLEKQLNEIIKSEDFYDEQAWAKKRLNSEAKELIEDYDALSNERRRRLNRLLMASATGGLVKRGSGNALEIWYGPWQWEGMSFSISFNEFANITLGTVTYFFDKFVMSIGLFIAILITANFIPETFLPGSLNLLMSKPITRWGLLVSKFVGGCAFVTLCAVYLFFGLWLWLGFAMGIWDQGILWSIPLYVVVFAIYYSVSTLVGVWSRSPILSIIVTAIFWAACFGVGLTYQLFDGRIDNSRTRGLVSVNDRVLQIGELNTVSTWDKQNEEWKKALEIKMMDEQRVAMSAVMFFPGAGEDGDLNTIGPVYDPKHDVVLSSVMNLANPMSMNHQDLFEAQPDALVFTEIGKMPRDAVKAVSDQHGVIVFTRNGKFFRYQGQSDSSESATSESGDGDKEVPNDGEKPKSGGLSLGNLTKSLLGKKKELFKEVGPDKRLSYGSGRYITHNRSNSSIFVLEDEKLLRFALDDDLNYVQDKESKIESTRGTLIAAGGDNVVLAFKSGEVTVHDQATLKEVNSYTPQLSSPYEQVIASADGRYFAFRCRNRTLWLLDTQNPDKISKANVSGQTEITAIDFDNQNQLWVATRSNQARLYDLDGDKNVKSLSPPTTWFTKLHEYGVRPLYWLFPKPGEFYKIITHLTANPDDDEQAEADLSAVQDKNDPWQPLWSGLLFMVGILFLTCLIFQFRDF